jgi:VanZ family protein
MNFAGPSIRAGAWAWLPVLAWAGVIFWLSATPNLRVASADDVDFVVRKAGHMCAFGILAVLFWRALAPPGLRSGRRGRAWIAAWVLAVAYAGSDEFHQSFTSGRHAALTDVGIDAAGALLFLVALAVWLRWRRGRATG